MKAWVEKEKEGFHFESPRVAEAIVKSPVARPGLWERLLHLLFKSKGGTR